MRCRLPVASDPRLGMQQTPDTKTIEANVIRPGGVFEVISGDKERAAEFKKRALELMEPFLRLKDEAAKEGFLIQWANIVPNPYGRH